MICPRHGSRTQTVEGHRAATHDHAADGCYISATSPDHTLRFRLGGVGCVGLSRRLPNRRSQVRILPGASGLPRWPAVRRIRDRGPRRRAALSSAGEFDLGPVPGSPAGEWAAESDLQARRPSSHRRVLVRARQHVVEPPARSDETSPSACGCGTLASRSDCCRKGRRAGARTARSITPPSLGGCAPGCSSSSVISCGSTIFVSLGSVSYGRSSGYRCPFRLSG
jgi:hypothetical protein